MPHKLLLADDSLTIQRVVELTFADEDIRVVAVADGRHAIERLQRERPDIILADISLPKPDGYEVAAFARRQPGLAHVPILLLMGAFETVDEERIAALGVSGVLVKPFEPQALIRRVQEALAGVTIAPGPHEVPPRAAAEPPAPAPDAPPARVTPPVAPRPTVMQARPAPPPLPMAAPPTAHGERSEARRAGEEGSSLDDYFDRLDAAFANLGHGTTEAPPAPATRWAEAASPAPTPQVWSADAAPQAAEPVALADDEWFDRADLASAPAPATVPDLPLRGAEDGPAPTGRAAAAPPVPALRPAPPAPVAEAPGEEVTAPLRLIAPPPREVRREPVAPLPVSPASAPVSVPTAPVVPVPSTVSRVRAPADLPLPISTPPAVDVAAPRPVAPPVRPTMSEVFGALLALEQGRSIAVPVAAGAISDAVIDEIVERVLARLPDALTRRLVPDIVSETAERLVREEIDRMRGRT